MIQVSNLSKWYGARKAIDGLNFYAKKGEIVGFLGPNGAGKTTTMRILTTFMPPSEGRAIVAGFDVVDESMEVRRRVGYMPETVPLYPDMTILEYLDYMAALREVVDADVRVDDAIQAVNLSDRVHSYIGNLSKGMKQRVGLAQAILHHPEVLILDEPTIGLDPVQVVEVRKLVREIGQERTVLLSTHILSEAQQLCNRVLIINQGHIIAEDQPDQLQVRMAGVNKYIVQLGADSKSAQKMLANIASVTAVYPKGNGVYEVESIPGREIRPEITRAVVNAGLDLVEIRSQDFNLEQVFLELTKSDSAASNKKRPGSKKE
jgi:ABC-2 type transport system ATP-binding protein